MEDGFIMHLFDREQMSFPWSMIDKIMPRPADSVQAELENAGVEDMTPIITSRNAYIVSFINVEGPQYFAIEDCFPNGKPTLEEAEVYMTDRDTVNKMERIKVAICLSPPRTALAVYGRVLGYTLIADEVKGPLLNKLSRLIGPGEGTPVVTGPGILSPENFVNEVTDVRIPNPFMPDTSQRIVTGTSQKTGIRYGETIKAYVSKYGGAGKLMAIPLTIAGWYRYLLAVDGEGKKFELLVDSTILELTETLGGIMIGRPEIYRGQLKSILSDANISGIDLYETRIGETVEGISRGEIAGPGVVRAMFKKYPNA